MLKSSLHSHFGDCHLVSSWWTTAIALLLTFIIGPAACQAQPATIEGEHSAKPGINDRFLDPDLKVEEWVERFEVESREVFRSRSDIVEHLELKKGDIVADIGAGTGLFVEPFSKAVGRTGWVIALDIAPKFVDRIGASAGAKKLRNVTPVLAGQADIRLPPESITVAFVCDTYHHFEFPQSTLASINRAMKSGGQLVIIDFERIPGVSREWTLGHVRAGKETFRREIEEAGFRFDEEIEISGLQENYFLRFRKP